MRNDCGIIRIKVNCHSYKSKAKKKDETWGVKAVNVNSDVLGDDPYRRFG
jgi:hypothetical protein